MGAPVSEDDLVITLLGSLSKSFAFLITALESRSDLMSWELVTSRLLHEDMKRKEQGGGVDEAAHGKGQAFMTTDNGRRKGRQAPAKVSNACHYCREHGHWIAKRQFEFVKTQSGRGRHNVQISRRMKTTLVIFFFRLVEIQGLPSRVAYGWSTRVRHST